MRGLKAVVFDMDDTLYPEAAFVRSGFGAVAAWAAAERGIAFETGLTELMHLFEQGIRHNTFNQWLARYGLDTPETVQRCIQIYREHIPRIEPFPEIPPLLTQLHSLFSLGLVSDGFLQVQRQKFQALQLAHFFRAVVFSDTWGRAAWKPSPRPFVAVLQELRVQGSEAIYIGDNPLKDFAGARQVGMKTIRYRYAAGEYGRAESPSTEHMPDLTILCYDELMNALQTWR